MIDVAVPIYTIANRADNKLELSLGIERKIKNDIIDLIYAAILDNNRNAIDGFLRVYYKPLHNENDVDFMSYQIGMIISSEPINVESFIGISNTFIQIEDMNQVEVSFKEKQPSQILTIILDRILNNVR